MKIHRELTRKMTVFYCFPFVHFGVENISFPIPFMFSSRLTVHGNGLRQAIFAFWYNSREMGIKRYKKSIAMSLLF